MAFRGIGHLHMVQDGFVEFMACLSRLSNFVFVVSYD